jgi:cation diffusion facilitator CzcD-associated flavoprotein CzcO
MSSTDTARDIAVERCEVCIVGAGIAGLNALFVASQYLSRDQRVILVDRRERVGGMWVDTYPYVRLHQPHPMFTAGNIEWTLGRDRSYLATKGEVLDHFQHCLNVIK